MIVLGLVPTRSPRGRGMTILPIKQMLQRLPILLIQEKAGDTSENLLNEIWKLNYSLHGAKQISKKNTAL